MDCGIRPLANQSFDARQPYAHSSGNSHVYGADPGENAEAYFSARVARPGHLSAACSIAEAAPPTQHPSPLQIAPLASLLPRVRAFGPPGAPAAHADAAGPGLVAAVVRGCAVPRPIFPRRIGLRQRLDIQAAAAAGCSICLGAWPRLRRIVELCAIAPLPCRRQARRAGGAAAVAAAAGALCGSGRRPRAVTLVSRAASRAA